MSGGCQGGAVDASGAGPRSGIEPAMLALCGMATSNPSVDPRAIDVATDDDDLTVDLADGRRVIVPLAWFPRLLHVQPDQRQNWRLVGDGQGVHWPDIDEDLSVSGLLRGTAAPDAGRRAI
jgi:hypothetical protein